MSNLDIIRGRSVVLNLTNQSGGTRSPGDVVVIDAANNEAFTVSSTSNYATSHLGIVDETIGIASNGRVVVSGYARNVKVSGTATRGEWLYHSSTQATGVGGAAIGTGAFGQFLKGGTGTTPSAIIFPTSQVTGTGGGGGAVATDAIWDAAGDLAVGTGANTAARLAIGTSGLLLKSNGTTATWARQTFIGCSAYKNASQTISNDTVTALLLDTEDYDTSAFHDTGSNTSRMTIPSGLDGKYLVTGYAYYDSNTSGQRQLFIQKNGSPVGPTDKRPPISGDNFYHVSHVLSLAATDYVELSTYQDSGGNRTIGDPSSFGDRYKVRFTITFLGV